MTRRKQLHLAPPPSGANRSRVAELLRNAAMTDNELETDDPRVITIDPVNPDAVIEQGYSPSEFIEDLFGRCNGEDMIAFGSRRPHPKDGEIGVLPLAPIPIDEWRTWFPEIQRHDLQQTQYMCFNPLHRRAAVKGSTEKYMQALRSGKEPLYFARNQKNITALSTICVDLDVGRPGTMTAGAAIGLTFDMAERGEIPMPSMYARSGRGLYVLWLIRQESSYKPPPTTLDNINRSNMAVSELLRRLASMEADHKSKDYSGWFKRHGTTDTKTGNEVVFIRLYPAGRPALFTLEHMLGSMGLHYAPLRFNATPTPAPLDTASKPPAKSKKTTGPTLLLHEGGKVPHGAEPADCRKRDLEKLLPHIIGPVDGRQGSRHFYLLYYFNAVCRLYAYGDGGKAKEQAARHVLRLNQALQKHGVEPLPESAIRRKVINQPWRTRLTPKTAVIGHLKITDRIAEEYHLEGLIPATLANSRKIEKRRAAAKRGELADAVDKILLDAKGKVSPTEVARRLGLGDYPQYVDSRKRRLVKKGLLPKSPGSSQTTLSTDPE